MINRDITDSELIKRLIKDGFIKNQTDLGRRLGLPPDYAKAYISSVALGKKPLADKYILMIYQLFPEFVGKYELNPVKKDGKEYSQVNEPISPYHNQQLNKKMEYLETQLKYLMHDVLDLKQKVQHLTEQLDSQSKQREQAS